MDRSRQKIKCKCSKGYFETVTELYHDIPYEVEKCSKCGHKLFTVEQVEKYQKILQLEESIKETRKVIQIGNSLGVTLPQTIKNFGIDVGHNAKLKIINDHSLQIDFA